MKTAAILAGGQARRMRPISEDIPKTLVEVAGKPILEWELKWLRSIGYDNFVILSGFLGNKIEEFLQSRPDISQNVKVVIEKEPLGTGGAIKNARSLLEGDGSFALVNGDSITDMRISKLKIQDGDLAVICLSRYQIPKGVVKSKGGVVTNFVTNPILKNCWISTGIYVLSREIFQYLPEKGAIEDLFSQMVGTGKIKSKKFTKNYWNAAETVKDVEQIGKDIESGAVSWK
jgi:mannose-1-phosphate guanylyltransferase